MTKQKHFVDETLFGVKQITLLIHRIMRSKRYTEKDISKILKDFRSEKLYSVKQVAGMLEMSETFIIDRCNDGTIRAYDMLAPCRNKSEEAAKRPPRLWRIPKDAIRKYLESAYPYRDEPIPGAHFNGDEPLDYFD